MTNTALIGLAKKIAGEPWDMIKLWRNADSAMSPKTANNHIPDISLRRAKFT